MEPTSENTGPYMEWNKFLENASPAVLVAFVVLYVFVKLIPQREQAHHNAMDTARKDYLAQIEALTARYHEQVQAIMTTHDKQATAQREAFLIEIERQRAFYQTMFDRMNSAIDKLSDRLMVPIQQGPPRQGGGQHQQGQQHKNIT